MFEETISDSRLAEPASGSGLRKPEWHALAARLAAARQLRTALTGEVRDNDGPTTGNFASFAHASASTVKKSPARVNPDGLADGKTDASIFVPAVSDAANAATGDREF